MLAEIELEVHAGRDEQGVLHRLGHVREELEHLLGRPEVQRLGGHPHPVLVGEGLPGVEAEEDLLGQGVLGLDVVDVVRGHERDAELAGDLAEGLVALLLALDVVPHDLQEEVLAEQGFVPVRGRHGLLAVPGPEVPVRLSRKAPGERDETLVVLLEQIPVDPGVVVEALHVGSGHELQEVRIAGPVLREERQVEGRDGVAHPFLPASRGDVGLDPDDRLHAVAPGGAVEVNRAEEVAVVRQGEGGQAQLRRPRGQSIDLACAVQKAVVRVHVQVAEVHSRLPAGSYPPAPTARNFVGSVAVDGQNAHPGRSPTCRNP